MRHLTLIALACIAVSLAAMRRADAQEPPPDGSPDIHGTWMGKTRALESHLGGSEKNGDLEKYPITVSVSQTNADITLDVTITRDEGPLTYRLTGKIGRGKFWAQGTDVAGTGNSLVVLGGVNAKGTAMKATQLLLLDAPVQANFAAKKQ